MKLFKSIAVRGVALLLFFAMISAVILWQAGAYDISFIKRPVAITTTGTGEGSSSEVTTKPFEGSLPSDDDEKIKEILDAIKTMEALSSEGYSLSYDVFAENSVIAKVDAPYVSGEFSLRTFNETKKVIYTKDNGRPGIKSQTESKTLTRIQLYYGYVLIDNGKTFAIYSPEGKLLKEDFNGTLVYARSVNMLPVVKENSKYYEIDPEEGFVQINESEILYKALAFDQPRYYGTSDLDLFLFSAEVEILTYVGAVTTTPPPTTPSDTTSGDGTESDSDSTPSITDPEITTDGTSTEQTAPSETTGAETTLPETSHSETTASDTSEGTVTGIAISDGINQAEVEGAASSEGTQSSAAETTVPQTSTGESAPQDTTASATSGTEDIPEGTTSGESEPDDTEITQTEQMQPVNGTIIKDGAYYKVTKAIRYGYKDKDGNVVIEPQFIKAYDFSPDGYAAVCDAKGQIFFIDKTGKETITLRYSYYTYPAEFNNRKLHQRYANGINMTFDDLGMYYFDDGYVMVRYALLDPYTASILYKTQNILVKSTGGSVAIPGNYTLENYSDGVMLLQKKGMYGYMANDMSWVCPAIFDDARPFVQGLAVASLNGKYGMIDTSGNTVLPFTFDYISNVSDGRIATYSDELGWQIYTIMSKTDA